MEEVIDLKEVLELLKRNLKWIIGLAVTFALIAFLYSALLKSPVYQSEAQVIINQKGKDTNVYNPGQVQTNLQLINTYSQMVNSKVVRQKVIDNLKLDLNEEDLAGRIAVTSEADSQLMKINVTGKHTKENAKIVNELASVTQKEVKRVMGVDNLSVFSKADENEEQFPIKPKPLNNAIIAGLLGAIIGTAIAFLKKMLDNRLNTEEKVEQYLGLPTLGKIHKIEEQG